VFCSKCGSLNPDGSSFCSTCGQQFPAMAASPLQPTPQLGASGVPATPQGVSPHWRPTPGILYAGFWLRLVAYFVDNVILGIPLLAVAATLFFGAGGMQIIHELRPHEEPGPQFFAFLFFVVGIFALVAILGTWLYYAYFENSSWQGTPGKKILNLYVTDMEGRPVTFGRASGRFFARIITRLIPLGIGYILAGFTEKKQALHDMIASCLVLRRY
jgi:uncharacterized RDD family membrane protein YckC